MDGSIGQACYGQAKAFHDSIKVGQVIVTKLDGHAKGGGALSAVAATKSPIIFIGVGEHFDDLEQFEAASFIKRLLGLGDLEGLMAKVQEQLSGKKQQKMLENLKEGKFTLRDMRDQFMQVMSMGSIGQLASMIPGLNSNLITKDKEKESAAKIQRFITAMDSMTKEELDCVKLLDESRIRRIARGAGVHPAEIQFLLMQHKQMSQVVKQVGSLANLGGDKKGGNLQQQMKRNPQAALQNMRKNLDPNLMNSMGGPGGIMEMAKSMQGSGGEMPDMAQAMKAVQGMMGGGGRGGGGGMPDMGKMMEMVQKMAGGGGGMPGMPGLGGGGEDGGMAGMGGMDPMAMMQQMMGGGGMPRGGGQAKPPGMGRGMKMRKR
jgi:signal recognition particle subunit SRP54